MVFVQRENAWKFIKTLHEKFFPEKPSLMKIEMWTRSRYLWLKVRTFALKFQAFVAVTCPYRPLSLIKLILSFFSIIPFSSITNSFFDFTVSFNVLMNKLTFVSEIHSHVLSTRCTSCLRPSDNFTIYLKGLTINHSCRRARIRVTFSPGSPSRKKFFTQVTQASFLALLIFVTRYNTLFYFW